MQNIKFDFSGKNFVVTGASSGMGKQVVLDLCAAGANVLAIARRLDPLKELPCDYASCDVRDVASLEVAIKEFVSKHGKLDGAVHAAGISALTPLRAFDRVAANDVMDISFWGGMNLMQIVNKKKYSNTGLSSVLFSSIAAYSGEKGIAIYSAAKASLQVAVKSIAGEINKDLHRINTVSPGWVSTAMTEKEMDEIGDADGVMNRHLLGIGKPSDVSSVVLFLLSDGARWITGTDIVVDGGYLVGE